MFGLLKKQNPYEQPAADVYQAVLAQTRITQFYEDYSVPDSFDGRFDLLMVHMFIVLHVLAAHGESRGEFAQVLFETCFADMDQTLREMGIGDMGLHKHMKRMLKGYNGRMNAYEDAMGDDAAMAEVLKRNLYGTVEAPDEKAVAAMVAYIQAQIDALKQEPLEGILSGRVAFG